MRWANFLHFYQPVNQQPDILATIVAQSYRPVLEGIKKNRHVRLSLNINGALFDLLHKYGYADLIEEIKGLVAEGRVEITGSAKYHPILPYLGEAEIERQINLNTETLKNYLGSWEPGGFFPPEMAYFPKLAPIVEKLGFKWMILDEISCGGEVGQVDYSQIYNVEGSKLKVFFRDRRLSNLIMSAVVRSRETLADAMREELAGGNYVVTAMDAETFGHHRPGLEKMLFEIFKTEDFELVKVSDLAKHYREKNEIVPASATWASSKEDIERGVQFLSWKDPENIIHKWQWEFTELLLSEVYRMDKGHPRYPEVRAKMDIALASDHFWWASAKPWWSLEMIEYGAYNLLETLRFIPDIAKDSLEQGRSLYEKIISTAFNWQRTGKIRMMMEEQKTILRIPFRDRTEGRGGAERGVYHAFVDMMKRLEKDATERGEYEKAILWRDARYKLENKLDIYDTINAIDLLRVEIPHKEVEETIEKYKAKYREIRGGQPEQRGS
ncbi:MAG: hypothetical protein AAB500_00620 [Patescibacteria group bacterium]